MAARVRVAVPLSEAFQHEHTQAQTPHTPQTVRQGRHRRRGGREDDGANGGTTYKGDTIPHSKRWHTIAGKGLCATIWNISSARPSVHSLHSPAFAMEHPCINFTTVARSVRLLKIDGFSLTGSMANDDFVRSGWSFDGYDWEIRIYPAINCSIALEVAFLSTPRKGSVRAAIAFQVVDPRGVIKPSNEVCVSWVFSNPQECSPKKVLAGRRELGASAFLRGDSFTMQCTITVLKELPDTAPDPIEEEVLVPSSNLHRHLAELLQSETGADVTFLVSGESFAAHKSILAARSPVFMAEFFGDMKEKCSHRVEIKDMNPVVFKALLHFIYTDTVAEFDEKDDVATVIAQHLLAAADMYGLDRLKLICEGKLSSGINVDTVATTLALAEQHGCPQLKAKCVRFIVRSPAVLDAVLATEGYKHLEASCPSVLADLLKSSLRMGGRTDA